MAPSATRTQLPTLLRAPWCVAIQDGREHRFTFVNETLRAALGGREIVHKTLAEAFPELDAASCTRAVAALESRQPSFAFDVPVTLDWRGDGVLATRLLSFSSQPLFGDAAPGAPNAPGGVGTLTIGLDVTEPAHERATASRWPADVLDAIPLPTMLVEPGTRRVIFANEAARAIEGGALPGGLTFSQAVGLDTGYRCTDAEGRAIPEDRLPSMRASRGERVDAFEMFWHTPTTVVPLLCFAERVEAAGASAAFVVLSFFDVTELRRHERELRSAQGARQAFLRRAAHELRTPLFALLLNVQGLRRAAPEARGMVAIERATLRMVTLVEQLIEIAQVADGVGFAIDDVDLVAVAHTCAARLGPRLEAAGCTLTVTGPPTLRGRWDAPRLEQVVDHLLSNAMRFGRGQPVRLECHDDEARASLTVTDGGPGIAPAAREEIFDRFRHSWSADPHGGFGVGLWLCRRIAMALGGTLEVEDAPGPGATFRCTLPKAGPAEPRPDAEHGLDRAPSAA